MRVLFASPFLSLDGHVKGIGALKAKSMADAGVDVTVIGFPPSYDLLPHGKRLKYISLQENLSATAIMRLECWIRRLGNIWLFLVEIFCVQWSAIRHARRSGFPILFFSDIEPWLLLPLLFYSKIRRPRFQIVGFVSFLFCIKSFTKDQPWYSRLRSRLNYYAGFQLLHWMDLVFDSTYWAARYSAVPARVHVIPDGYECFHSTTSRDDARIKLGIPAHVRVLLHFGVATPGKGTDLLVAALKNVSPSFELYIVGKNGIFSREDLLYDLPSEWRSHLHLVQRYVTEEERLQYFSACDVVVLPYRIGFLGSSGNFRDAISHGKAIVVSNQYLMGEMVSKYNLGILFRPGDVADLSRALLELKLKPDTWFQDIAERSKAVVKELSWDNTGIKYRELFEQLLSERTGGGKR